MAARVLKMIIYSNEHVPYIAFSFFFRFKLSRRFNRCLYNAITMTDCIQLEFMQFYYFLYVINSHVTCFLHPCFYAILLYLDLTVNLYYGMYTGKVALTICVKSMFVEPIMSWPTKTKAEIVPLYFQLYLQCIFFFLT